MRKPTFPVLAVILILACLSLVGWTRAGAPNTTWTYKIFISDLSPDRGDRMAETEKQLNQLGAEGWELVHAGGLEGKYSWRTLLL